MSAVAHGNVEPYRLPVADDTETTSNAELAAFVEELQQDAEEEKQRVEHAISDPNVTPEETQANDKVSETMKETGEQQGLPLLMDAGLTVDDMHKLRSMYAKLIAVVPKTIPKSAMQNAADTLNDLLHHPIFKLEQLHQTHTDLKLAWSCRNKSLYNWRKTLARETIMSKKGKEYTRPVYERDGENIIYPESVMLADGSICTPKEDIEMAKKFKKQLNHIGMFIGVVTMMLHGRDNEGNYAKNSWQKKTEKLHKTAKALRTEVIKAEPLYDVGRNKQSNGARMKRLKDMHYGKYFLPAVAMQMAGQNMLRHSNNATGTSSRATRSRSLGRASTQGRANRPTNSKLTMPTRPTLGNRMPGNGDAKPGWMRNLGL